ncbi:MAG: DinB family protein [Alphaproteobacteria bacterium]|nr:DinB family protein [Alphaproteobacteria bacterium]MBU1551779.1 DinB family protein [Alphaproteobacteria bacterium]MBU2335207.1 DinB family protein [Alphaproteobacteria bacterium]MBU2391237.1 DinB family protein [Alphaproteobacteria bacterium]
MRRHFQMFADYNRWANALVYEACAELTEAEYRADQGAFFGSAHRTLNHLLCADRIWMKRVTGSGEAPTALDTILHEDFAALREARIAEDQRIIDWIETLDEGKLAASFTYSPISSSTVITQPLGPVLAHVFNHQTHHRGQVHMILTSLGRPSVVLDLVYFLRGDGKRWL